MSLKDRVMIMQTKLDLPEDTCRDLLTIHGMNILVIADDSSSMSAVSSTANVYEPTTRWDELKQTLMRLVTMMLVVDNHGFDLKFMNDDNWYKINSEADLTQIFQSKSHPLGLTPLKANLSLVLSGTPPPLALNSEGETLVIVMTDGEPSDTNFNSLRNQIQTRPPQTYVTFIMCTEEDAVVDAYQSCIDPIKGVDIVDDYKSEKKLCEGHGNKLSFNMYLGKCLMGAKLDKYGHMDEKNMNAPPKREGGCCTLS
ncbi:hypothetical protein TrCOL_g2882 [Triparma columacea]|uniref:VWFA domain-containing protein n=1 Tax=Triparma columacea TaxID=722753 RepID=A0A9W7GF85_9STRA|nr:hypothetical protein TrCOL_g2882 [Triparma columacea]